VSLSSHLQNGPWCVSPGFNAKQEILNVIPDGLNSYYYKMDNRVLDNREVTYYRCTDLFIGATLNVYSRRIVLVKCDRLTEDFYRTVYGLGEYTNDETSCTCEIKICIALSQWRRQEFRVRFHSSDKVIEKKNKVTSCGRMSDSGGRLGRRFRVVRLF